MYKKRSGAGSSFPTIGNAPSAQLKFRPSNDPNAKSNKKGTKPLPDPVTVPEILTKVAIHICRKILFIDPKIRVAAYAFLFFFVSLVADNMTFPKTYFSNKGNIPNQYFVKFSWAWTFVFGGLFLFLTSSVYTCGRRTLILRHLARLIVGTIVWFLCTGIFLFIEERLSTCILSNDLELYSLKNKKLCLEKKGKWVAFDISGHAFLLIWCVFFITEEAKVIIGWDTIKDSIRSEEHLRTQQPVAGTSSSSMDASASRTMSEKNLNGLLEEDLTLLKILFKAYDIYVKLSLVALTILCILWDVMLVATAVYFHTMMEKVIGAATGVLMWYLCYKILYPNNIIPILLPPGRGAFKYSDHSTGQSYPLTSTISTPSSNTPGKQTVSSSTNMASKSRGKDDDIKKFMGMPLNPLNPTKKTVE